MKAMQQFFISYDFFILALKKGEEEIDMKRSYEEEDMNIHL